jgi:hypothetical protein
MEIFDDLNYIEIFDHFKNTFNLDPSVYFNVFMVLHKGATSKVKEHIIIYLQKNNICEKLIQIIIDYPP